ncbi:hypothetical protein B566_EDAN014396 [Ephemera danica]|nr:hypothetical protein B566_EDAN014396 [Ephemera danica]
MFTSRLSCVSLSQHTDREMKLIQECSTLLIVLSFKIVLAAENGSIKKSTCDNQLQLLQVKLEECEESLEVVYQLPEETRKVTPREVGRQGRWVQTVNGEVPPGAFSSGNFGSIPSYGNVIGRTWPSEDSAVPCWFYQNHCYFVWKGKQTNKDNFEYLVGEYNWQWTNSSEPIPENALIGGYRKNERGSYREMLYIGRTHFSMPSSKDALLHVGHVEGNTRELVHSVSDRIQRKSTYQILIKN